MKKEQIFFLIIVVLAFVFFVLSQSMPLRFSAASLPTDVNGELLVESQRPAQFVIAKRVIMPTAGFLVIHNNLVGQVGAVVGVSDYFEAGYYNNAVALMERETLVGQSLIAVLYEDDGDKQFDAHLDRPARNSNGDVVATDFLVIDDALLEASGLTN